MMSRRKLLERIVQGFTVTGLGFVIYPFFKAWIPGFSEDLSLEVPLADLAPGETRTVNWLGRRVLVRRQSTDMVAAIEAGGLALKDPASADSRQPSFALNEFRALQPEYFVAFNNCTHLGCEVAPVNAAGVGFTCPCHQSDYDYAGRVVEGAAAPVNLEIPNYRFVSRNTLRLEQGDHHSPNDRAPS
jgi:ubiquinol-cytochrome c reductase iron-sulfur subunit